MKKKKRAKSAGLKAKRARGAARKTKRRIARKGDGGVSHKRAVAYGKLAARLGRTIHTAMGRRPAHYTRGDAIVAQKSAAAERARLKKGH